MKVYSRLIATIIVVTFIFLLLLSTLFFSCLSVRQFTILMDREGMGSSISDYSTNHHDIIWHTCGVIVAYVVNKRVRFLEQSLSLILKKSNFH